MTSPMKTSNLSHPFQGWDELRQSAPMWKIEKPAVNQAANVPFFPDQNGKVYEQLLHNMPVLMHAMDGSGRITAVNAQWTKALGYLISDVEGRMFTELLAPESRTRLVQKVMPAYLQSGVCRDEVFTIMRKDGAPAQILLSMNAYRGDKGRIERSVCILTEPVSIKVEQAVTVVDDRRFKGAFEGAAHGMALVAPTGEIAVANDAFWSMLKRKPDNATLAFDDLLHKDDRMSFLNGVGELIQGSRPNFRDDLRFTLPDGKAISCSTTVALVRNEHGEIEQLTIQVVDNSEKLQSQRNLQHAQKMEAIGQLTGGLAHDFNNLLTVVIGNLQLLESKLEGDERGMRRLAEAIDASRKGSDLTKQMLAFARKQALEPTEVKINSLVTGISPLLARTIGETIELKVDAMAGEPKAIIDASQLESAVLNLAINARDAMPKGGLLTIETQPAYLDKAYAAKHPEVTPGHYVMVAVSDTGAGIPPDVLEKVFQPFFTTKEAGKGSGLGLAMVYGFIKQSGGHISVYSEVGHGTAIKMYLPRKFAEGEAVPDVTIAPVEDDVVEIAAAPEPVAVEEPAPPLTIPEKKAPKLLVVEDQEAVRAVACGFLTDFGYEVIEAEDGLQALAKLQENPDVDLMFSDVVMPGGMNGFDLAQAARSMRPGLKIVHTSGYPKGAMVHQEEPRFREGFIIMKPYRREDLQKIVKEALDFQE
jgi:PAS domain S-box-containing protein